METVQVKSKGPAELANELKKEADKNKVFQDVCTVFALRERARGQVTINSLAATMNKEGYKHDKDAYKDVIARMARLGLGKLHKDTKGRVRALTDVKYTLQSIGLSAVGEKLDLSPFAKSKRYAKLPETVAEVRQKAAAPVTDKTVLHTVLGGKEINIPLTQEQFTSFLADLLTKQLK